MKLLMVTLTLLVTSCSSHYFEPFDERLNSCSAEQFDKVMNDLEKCNKKNIFSRSVCMNKSIKKRCEVKG